MPKAYLIIVVIRYEDGDTTERTWGVTVLARNEHLARRLIIDKVLRWGALVSHFLEVERCV